MTEKQSFGVFVRAFGLVTFVYGVYGTIHTLIELLGLKVRYSEPIGASVLLSIQWLAIGIILLRGADLIVRFGYSAVSKSN